MLLDSAQGTDFRKHGVIFEFHEIDSRNSHPKSCVQHMLLVYFYNYVLLSSKLLVSESYVHGVDIDPTLCEKEGVRSKLWEPGNPTWGLQESETITFHFRFVAMFQTRSELPLPR